MTTADAPEGTPRHLVLWDEFIQIFSREWTPVLGLACAAQTLAVFEQVWRYGGCSSTSREVSGETIRTGFITQGGKKVRVHGGLGIDGKTFRRHLQNAKAHGLIETSERPGSGYRVITTFYVFPSRAVAGPHKENLPTVEIEFSAPHGETLPTAIGKTSRHKKALSSSASARSVSTGAEIAAALESRWSTQDRGSPSQAAVWIVASWTEIDATGVRRPKPAQPDATFVAAFPIIFIRAWNRSRPLTSGAAEKPVDDTVTQRNRTLAAALMAGGRT